MTALRLDLNRKDRWITLLPGVRVHVHPMGTAFWMMAQADNGVLAAVRAARAEPAPLTPDEGGAAAEPVETYLSAGSDGSIAFSVALTKAVAARVIFDWEGVGDLDGAVIPCSADGVAALLDIREAYDAFCAEVLAPWLRVLDEKKD